MVPKKSGRQPPFSQNGLLWRSIIWQRHSYYMCSKKENSPYEFFSHQNNVFMCLGRFKALLTIFYNLKWTSVCIYIYIYIYYLSILFLSVLLDHRDDIILD